jgi:hypothetical protein
MIKKVYYTFISLLLASVCLTAQQSVLIETESFSNKGGWVVDQQFMDLMGSSYLLAHGMGIPVKDAETEVEFPATGTYNVFVRTFNWTSPWYSGEGPGKFRLLINGFTHRIHAGCRRVRLVLAKRRQREYCQQESEGWIARPDRF